MPLLKGLMLQDNYTLTHEQKEKTVTIIREYHNKQTLLLKEKHWHELTIWLFSFHL